jgi:hypothetical protein
MTDGTGHENVVIKLTNYEVDDLCGILSSKGVFRLFSFFLSRTYKKLQLQFYLH